MRTNYEAFKDIIDALDESQTISWDEGMSALFKIAVENGLNPTDGKAKLSDLIDWLNSEHKEQALYVDKDTYDLLEHIDNSFKYLRSYNMLCSTKDTSAKFVKYLLEDVLTDEEKNLDWHDLLESVVVYDEEDCIECDKDCEKCSNYIDADEFIRLLCDDGK